MCERRATEKFYGVQVLRFVAATLVVAAHVLASVRRNLHTTADSGLLKNGVLGVDIFFGISGFVIYLSAIGLQQRRDGGWHTAKEFFRRRFLRVAPSYYLLTCAKLAVFLVAPAAMAFFRPHLLNTVASFLFVTRVHGGNLSQPVLTVGWTLCYEMMFYLLVTVLLLFRVPVFKGAALAIGVSSLIGLLVRTHEGIAAFLFNPVELEFLGGMAIAAAVPILRKLAWPIPVALLLLGLWLGLLAPHVGQADTIADVHFRFFAIPGLLIVVAIVALERRVHWSRLRTLLLLGDASYALYLTHEFVLPPTVRLTRQLGSAGGPGVALAFVATLALCYAVAVAYHLWLEDPLTRTLLTRLPWSLRSATSKSGSSG